MPELPDLTVYVEALSRFAVGAMIEELRVRNAFLLRTPYPQTSAHRSSNPERHRQRLLGRDPPPRAVVTVQADGPVVGGGVQPPPGGNECSARRVDGEASLRGWGRLSGPGDGVPRRDGGARPLQPALSGLRRAGSAHPLRGIGVQLLPRVSDRWSHPGRPLALAIAEGRLAENARRPRTPIEMTRKTTETQRHRDTEKPQRIYPESVTTTKTQRHEGQPPSRPHKGAVATISG